MAKIAHLDHAFLQVFEQEVSPVEGQSLQQDKRGRKRKGKEKSRKKKTKQKHNDVGHSLVQNLRILTPVLA